MKKNKLVTVIGLSLSLSAVVLSGCSNTSKDNGQKEQSSQVEKQSKQLRFAEVANSNKRTIWYETEKSSQHSVGKDSYLRYIYVTQNGKITSYDFSHIDTPSFKDLKGLSDGQVIAKAKAWDKESFEKGIASSDVESAKSLKYSSVAKPIKVEVSTDSSGNKIVGETLTVQSYAPMDNYSKYELDDHDVHFADGYGLMTVYDKTYTGFAQRNGDSLLMTKTDKNAKITPQLDDAKTKNVKVSD